MEETISRPDSICPEMTSNVGGNMHDQSNFTGLTQDQSESINYLNHTNDPNMSNYSTATSSQPTKPMTYTNQLFDSSSFVHPASVQSSYVQQQQRIQTMDQSENKQPAMNLPNTSIYALGHNQVQSYPYSTYSAATYQQHPSNVQQLSTSTHNPQYQIASYSPNVTVSNFVHPSMPYNPNAYHSLRRTQFVNNPLNSSLHQPHSIDLNDSLSRSFNGVPSNFALLNPPAALVQTLSPFLAQNNQLATQLNDWLTSYHIWQEDYKRNCSLINNKNLIPLKFEKAHSSIRFANANQLIAVKGKSVFLQNIKPTLIESGEQTLINTWPGPLVRDVTNKNDVMEYVKGQEKIVVSNPLPEYFYLNQEKSQIWQLLSMMIKQNGDLSSSELAEFLIAKNESEFYTDDGGEELGKFRRFLLLGQKKNALDHARKVRLWGHSFALAYLISMPHFNETMINSVNDFTDSELTKDDPIFTLYRRLLQNLQKSNPKLFNSICTVLPPSNLQQFTILLANNCEISPVLPGSAFVSEVLKLIVALRDGRTNFIDLNSLENFFLRNLIKSDSITYSEELLFMNEIFEFCQKPNQPIIEIIPFKTIFAAKLYDYGLISQAREYCKVIGNTFKEMRLMIPFNSEINRRMSKINWNLIMYIIEQIESRIDKVLSDPLYSYETSPVSNESRRESSPEEADEDESEQNDLVSNELDSELENLHLNNDPATSLQQSSDKMNRNFVNPFTPMQPQKQQSNINLQHSQTQQQKFIQPSTFVQQRDRSDSVQSRQRTNSRSSTVSNLQPTQQQHQAQFQKPPQNRPMQSKPPQQQFSESPTSSTVKTNDPLASLPNSQNFSGQMKPKTEPVKPPAQQPSFFIPEYSSNDDLPPPIDFVSKPIDPTNILAEHNDSQNESTDAMNTTIPKQPFNRQLNHTSATTNFNSNNLANFNSTLNPPMAQTSQNYRFSPLVSPITSPVLANQNQSRNVDNMMNRDERTHQQQQNKKQEDTLTHLDQTDSNLKNEKSGLFQWVRNKIVPKGPNEAHLPDDSKERFVYDHTLNRWIDTEEENDEQNQVEDQIRQGPPKIPIQPAQTNSPPRQTTQNSLSTSHNFTAPPPMINPSQFSFTKSKQKRYVDIFQQ